MINNKILIVGGGGYVGTKLSYHLLLKGYNVSVLDTFWFGNYFNESNGIKLIKGDIRNEKILIEVCKNQDVVILLACLSNDPMADIDPDTTKNINYRAVANVIKYAKESGVNKLIYASSASVYGIQEIERVTEDIPLKPLTLYSKFKADIEKIVNQYASDDFTVVSVRSATVCGYSPRMRLDLLVNFFVFLAMKNKMIFIEGGEQIRPLINIKDIVEFYELMINAPKEKIHKEIFNVSSGNFKVIDVAYKVQNIIPCEINFSEVIDTRSYPVCADKAEEVLSYNPKYSYEDAIHEVKDAIETKKLDINDPKMFNLKYLKTLFANQQVQIY